MPFKSVSQKHLQLFCRSDQNKVLKISLFKNECLKALRNQAKNGKCGVVEGGG